MRKILSQEEKKFLSIIEPYRDYNSVIAEDTPSYIKDLWCVFRIMATKEDCEGFTYIPPDFEKVKVLYCSLKNISFEGLFLSDKFAYILASGDINYNYLNENSNWVKKSYLLKLRDGKIVEQIAFDYGLSNVENIVVEGNRLIVGMDKIVAIIDLYTKEIKSFTPISIEAEKDILKTKGY